MDLTAEFYLQTVQTVFSGAPSARRPARCIVASTSICGAIEKTALMTVEGERDDICGLGQTEAAHDLCSRLPVDEKFHYVQPGVGHYGVFNGTRWRTEIQPRIREFIRTINFKRLGDEARPEQPYRLKSEAVSVAPEKRMAKVSRALNGAHKNGADRGRS